MPFSWWHAIDVDFLIFLRWLFIFVFAHLFYFSYFAYDAFALPYDKIFWCFSYFYFYFHISSLFLFDDDDKDIYLFCRFYDIIYIFIIIFIKMIKIKIKCCPKIFRWLFQKDIFDTIFILLFTIFLCHSSFSPWCRHFMLSPTCIFFIHDITPLFSHSMRWYSAYFHYFHIMLPILYSYI